MAIIFQDFFSVDSSSLEGATPDTAGTVWQLASGSDPSMTTVTGGVCRTNTSFGTYEDQSYVEISPSPATTAVTITANVDFSGNSGAPSTPGFFWCRQDSSNFYKVACSSGTAISLYVVSGGTETVLATYDTGSAIVGTITIKSDVGSHTVSYNGSDIITSSDSTITTAGTCGVITANSYLDPPPVPNIAFQDITVDDTVTSGGPVIDLSATASLMAVGYIAQIEAVIDLQTTASLSANLISQHSDYDVVSYRFKSPYEGEEGTTWLSPANTYIEASPYEHIRCRILIQNSGMYDNSTARHTLEWRRDDNLGWRSFGTGQAFRAVGFDNLILSGPFSQSLLDRDEGIIRSSSGKFVYSSKNNLFYIDVDNGDTSYTFITSTDLDTTFPSAVFLGSNGTAILFGDMYDSVNEVANKGYALSLDGGDTWGASSLIWSGTANSTNSKCAAPNLFEMPDGNLLAVWAGDSNGTIYAIKTTSSDWSSWETAASTIGSDSSLDPLYRGMRSAYDAPNDRLFLASVYKPDASTHIIVSWIYEAGVSTRNTDISLSTEAVDIYGYNYCTFFDSSGNAHLFIQTVLTDQQACINWYVWSPSNGDLILNTSFTPPSYADPRYHSFQTDYSLIPLISDGDIITLLVSHIREQEPIYISQPIVIDLLSGSISYPRDQLIIRDPSVSGEYYYPVKGVTSPQSRLLLIASNYQSIITATFTDNTPKLESRASTTQLLGTGTIAQVEGQAPHEYTPIEYKERRTSVVTSSTEYELETEFVTDSGFETKYKYEIRLIPKTTVYGSIFDHSFDRYLQSSGAQHPDITLNDSSISALSSGRYVYYLPTAASSYIEFSTNLPEGGNLWIQSSRVLDVYENGTLIGSSSSTLSSLPLSNGNNIIRVLLPASSLATNLELFYLEKFSSPSQTPDYAFLHSTYPTIYFRAYQIWLKASASIIADPSGSTTTISGQLSTIAYGQALFIGSQRGSILGRFPPVGRAFSDFVGYKGVTIPDNPISFSGVAAISLPGISYSTQQLSFRFRNDDGDEQTASWIAPLNEPISVLYDTIYRCRIAVQNTGISDTVIDPRWQIEVSINGAAWKDYGALREYVYQDVEGQPAVYKSPSTPDVLFSYQSPYASDDVGAQAVAFYQQKSGRMHIVYGGSISGEPTRCLHQFSDDGGYSWSYPTSFVADYDTDPGITGIRVSYIELYEDEVHNLLVIMYATTVNLSTTSITSYRITTSNSDGWNWKIPSSLPLPPNNIQRFLINSVGDYVLAGYKKEIDGSDVFYQAYLAISEDKGKSWYLRGADADTHSIARARMIVDAELNQDDSVQLWVIESESIDYGVTGQLALYDGGVLRYPYTDYTLPPFKNYEAITSKTGYYVRYPRTFGLISTPTSTDSSKAFFAVSVSEDYGDLYDTVVTFKRSNNQWAVNDDENVPGGPRTVIRRSLLPGKDINGVSLASKYNSSAYPPRAVIFHTQSNIAHAVEIHSINESATTRSLSAPVITISENAVITEVKSDKTINLYNLRLSSFLDLSYESKDTTQQISVGSPYTYNSVNKNISLFGLTDTSDYSFPAQTIEEYEFSFSVNDKLTNAGDVICFRLKGLDDYYKVPCVYVYTNQLHVYSSASVDFSGWTDGPKISTISNAYINFAPSLTLLGIPDLSGQSNISPRAVSQYIGYSNFSSTSSITLASFVFVGSRANFDSVSYISLSSHNYVAPNAWTVQATAQVGLGSPDIDVYYRASLTGRAYLAGKFEAVRSGQITLRGNAYAPFWRGSVQELCTSAQIVLEPDYLFALKPATLVLWEPNPVLKIVRPTVPDVVIVKAQTKVLVI